MTTMSTLSQGLTQLPGRAAETLFGEPSQLEQYLSGNVSAASSRPPSVSSAPDTAGDNVPGNIVTWPVDSVQKDEQQQLCPAFPTALDLDYDDKKRNPNCLKLSVYSILLMVVLFAVLILGRDYVKLVLRWLERRGIWESFGVFLGLFILTALPMMWGYALLNVAAGYLYGWVYGVLCTIVCAQLGVMVCHILVRRLLKKYVLSQLPQENIGVIFNIVEGKQGFKVVALSRLTPIPFGLQNALFSVTEISTARYLSATAVGMLPTQGLNTYLGSTLRSMEDVLSDNTSALTGYIVFTVQLLITILLTVFIVRKAKSELKKTVEKLNSEETPDGDTVKLALTELAMLADEGYVIHHSVGRLGNCSTPSTPKTPSTPAKGVFVYSDEER